MGAAFAALYRVLPYYVDDWKVVSGQLMVHLTPEAQEQFFDPPAPAGPVHETKVFNLRTWAFRLAGWIALAVVAGAVAYAWRTGPSAARPSAQSRWLTSLWGTLMGGLAGSAAWILLLHSFAGALAAAGGGCAAGALVAALAHRRGLPQALLLAGIAAAVAGMLSSLIPSWPR